MFHEHLRRFVGIKMDPFAMYITHADLPPPYVIPRRKKRLKQLQLELEQEYVCCGLRVTCVCFDNSNSSYNYVS